ncbi:MAG: hypothetical protein AAF171_23660 [Cyanobacteria bacterium P01_A01_bin.116]
MKSSHHAEASAPTNYAPSVPMSVYRELAAELRANKAVIDSLNSRNQQLLQQNQFLKQEIHNVVQATLTLGQAAGVARQAAQGGAQGFPSAIAPDTLARLVKAETRAQAVGQTQDAEVSYEPSANQVPHQGPNHIASQKVAGQRSQQVAASQPIAQSPIAQPVVPRPPQSASPAPVMPQTRVPRPIAPKPASKKSTPVSQRSAASKQASQKPRQQAAKPVHPSTYRPTETVPGKGTMVQGALSKPKGKLFTEQTGEYRSSVLDSQDGKEIGGIWLALSIILIIVTAFGAGFLIMKPLLNDR